MRTFLILALMNCVACLMHKECKVNRVQNTIRKCDGYYGCRNYPVDVQNATCTNLDEMHATPNICIRACTILFTGKNGILRTNSFSLLDNLEQVFLNDTEMVTIQKRAFTGAPSIRMIDLRNNQINKIPKNTFSQLRNLTFLDLSNNKIEDIEEGSFDDCHSLNTIDLSSNNLKNLSSSKFESLLQLKTINLSRNSLEIFDPNWCFHFHSLKNLILDHNRLSSLGNCSSNFNIEILSISHNELEVLNGSFIPINLKELNLSSNLITALQNKPFHHLTQLEVLDMSRNELDNLPFELFVNLKKLKHLDISSNALVTLKEGVFHGLVSLKFLNLSNVHSRDLEANVFYSTKNITEIDISNNKLVYFDTGALFELCPKLLHLKIDGNDFTCTDLIQILVKADKKKISIIPGHSYNTTNLNGIPCIKEKLESPNNSISSPVRNFFEKSFMQSSFVKFFSTFKQPRQNDIQELIDLQKYFIRNVSMEITNSEKKLVNDVLLERKNFRKADDTDQLLQKMLKVIETTKGSEKDANLTSQLFTILDQQNRAALTAEDADMKNLISSLRDLKVLFIICTFILITVCVLKLFKKIKTHFPVNKFVIENQELPFINRHNSEME